MKRTLQYTNRGGRDPPPHNKLIDIYFARVFPPVLNFKRGSQKMNPSLTKLKMNNNNLKIRKIYSDNWIIKNNLCNKNNF